MPGISRADVAAFLVETTVSGSFVRQTVVPRPATQAFPHGPYRTGDDRLMRDCIRSEVTRTGAGSAKRRKRPVFHNAHGYAVEC